MSALIPIKNDPEKNEVAMAGVRSDKSRDANDGYDGGWVAHPGLVEPAMGGIRQGAGRAQEPVRQAAPGRRGHVRPNS
jgi:malate synthase